MWTYKEVKKKQNKKKTHSLAHSTLSVDLGPDKGLFWSWPAPTDSRTIAVRTSFVRPGQGRGNQSLPTELLI